MRSDIVLVSDLGRSGQGWLSYMLCYILNAAYIEPYMALDGQIFTRDERILSLVCGRLPGREPTRYSLVIKTHNYPAPKVDLTEKIILIVRDPRDVSVGMFYLNRRRLQENQGGSWKIRLAQNLSRSKMMNLLLICRNWLRLYTSWQKWPHYLVRYEDLSRDTANTLRAILQYLEVEAPQQVIEDAVRHFSFESMSGGRKRGEGDNSNYDQRKGIIGDHRNFYSSAHLRLCSALYRDRVLSIGYDLNS